MNLLKTNLLIKIKGISTTSKIFKLVEKLEQNKNVIFAEPNFTRFLKPQTDDPFTIILNGLSKTKGI